jgi:glycosyltransferase involved in cell wall biosynthesis
VIAGSDWVKKDIIKNYNINPEKIQVIPWAAPTQAYPAVNPERRETIREKYKLDIPFAFYPAMTWEHKNHIRLIEAVKLLHDRNGLKINLICTGQQNDFWPRIQERLLTFGMQEQVRFLGLVPPEDLRMLYSLAQFVIIPTLFEAASGPLFEAWEEDTPVACSNVTSLPEQAGEAALLFNPLSVDAIADAMAQMATKPELRQVLKQRGAIRRKDFDWARTAKAYRAVYRRAANRTLSEEDRWFLSRDWMRISGTKKEK